MTLCPPTPHGSCSLYLTFEFSKASQHSSSLVVCLKILKIRILIWNMDFLTPIVTPVVESLLVPVKRHLGFLVSSSNKVKDVHVKLTELDGAASDMHTQQVSSTANRRVVPHRVPDWLAEVQAIKSEMAEKIPTGRVGCFNLKMRYKAGRDSSDILKHIERLMKEKAGMVWTNEIIPLGAVSPPRPSTSPPVHEDTNQYKIRIESRFIIFKDALKSLEPNNIKTQKIALCGMAGVGKTTMMEELVKAANDRKMFDYIVKVVVGQNPNLVLVQQTIAEQTGETLSETTNDTRAKHLKERFKVRSEEGRKKILVIVDDIWEVFNLEYIGLTSPLPNGFKLLLTSREETACIDMGIETSSIFKIEVLKDPEDKNLFWETTGLGSHNDITDLLQIGEDIIKRCRGLPIAIKTIASTLKNIKERHEWNHALFCIQNQDFPVIINIFEFSYKNLKEDDLKATFLLSGLFLEDSDIGIEDLVMYGWGLKFFKNVHSIAKARSRVHTYVNKVIRSNLLIKSDREGCVKMHDLVRDFVLSVFSKVSQASIVNHNNNVSQQLKEEKFYERILLKCEGMLEFPIGFNHPNLKLLKLLDGNKLLKFPTDFFDKLEKLEVIAYNDMHLPLLPQYSTNLRALCLRSCSLVDNDVSFLGDLINLEVLNLADCGIHKLPSKIGKLKKLKLLDLSGCANLCIDDGVFQNLNQLEELYMGVCEESNIRLSYTNCRELKILSMQLSALELEFFNNKAEPVNVSFENLERFRIFVGCLLENTRLRWRSDKSDGCNSFKNTLMLETSSSEVRECKINKLFRKTEVLHLKVSDLSYLDDILTPSPQSSFCNLKVLSISNCEGLTYLFTNSVANGLINLERLSITSCSILKSVVNDEAEAGVVTFHRLKLLSLKNLPELVSLCGHVSVLELPDLMELHLEELPNFTSIFSRKNIDISTKGPFFNHKVMIPKLEKLRIIGMKNLKDIWECEITASEGEVNNTFMLRKIEVNDCNNVVNIFPKNPMRLLTHLEKLRVDKCGSVEVLFDIELGRFLQLSSCSLRNIAVWRCESLREVWRIKGAENNYFIDGFQAIETINICQCEKFRNIVTPTTAKFDMRALKEITVESYDEYGERNNELPRAREVVSNRDDDDDDDEELTSSSVATLFPRLHLLQLHYMKNLKHIDGQSRTTTDDVSHGQSKVSQVDVVSWSLCQYSREIGIDECDALSSVIPYYAAGQTVKLQELSISGCASLMEVFESKEITGNNTSSCSNSNAVAISRPTSSIVHKLPHLKMLRISRCDCLENVFTFSTLGSLKKLEKLRIRKCGAMKVIVREEVPEDTMTLSKNVVFTSLKSIELDGLPNLTEYVKIEDCPQMTVFTSGRSTTPRL
ncbi:hypothetical protein M8C21_009098, partial [Ambrosia artemisiifolia]